MTAAHQPRRIMVGAVTVGVVTLLLYTLTCCRTVSPVGDAGELTAAAATLGIPHAPGYPFFVLIGHVFSWIPLGNMATRINGMAAFLGALAAVVCYQAFVELGLDLLVAGTAALFLSTSAAVWQVSLSGEFRSLQLLLSLGVVALVFRHWRPDRGALPGLTPANGMRLLALLFGLGLATHYTFAVLALLTILVLVVTTWTKRGRTQSTAPWWQLILCFLAGLLPYLFLPVRAAQQPFMNWGDPSTLSGLWWVLSRAGYGGVTQLKAASSPGLVGTQLALKQLLLACWNHFTPIGALLAAIGCGSAFKRYLAPASYMALCMLFMGPVFVVWEHPLNDPHFWGGLERQLLLFWVGFAFFVAVGLQTVSAMLKPHRWQFLLPLFLMWPIMANYGVANLHGETIGQCYGHDLLTPLQSDAYLFISSDPAYSTTVYAQAVEHLRPDVSIIALGLLHSPWYQQQLSTRHPTDLQGFSFDSLAQSGDPNPLIDWLLKKHAVYLDNPWPSIDERLMEQGVVYRVAATPDDVAHLDPLTYRQQLDQQVARWRPSSILTADRLDAAACYVRYIADEYALAYANLGVGMGRRGWDADARQALNRALELNPHCGIAHFNLGFVFASHEDYPHALEQYRDAVEDDPTNVSAYQALAEVCTRTGNIEEATRIKAQLDRLQTTASPQPSPSQP